jgi:exodeoxyribonuclease V alpha subunit
MTNEFTPPRPPRREAPPEGNPEAEITGVVENIVYRSEESGYTVCRIKITGHKDPVTVVGSCPAIWEGETLKATGSWTRHPQHGHQFQAETLTCIVPTSARGIERYLASGMIRGIGKVMAKRLVEKFGAQTLEVIEKESARLEDVEGVGTKRRKMIKDSWVEQKAVRDIMIFLQSHGVGLAQSARIYRQYGNHAVALISENPYRLCRDIWGIGFKTADGVARSIGIPTQSDVRARAGLVHTMQTMTEEGHCFSSVAELTLQAQALLDIPAEILSSALQDEVARGAFIRDGDRIYLAALHAAELAVSAKIHRLQATAPPHRPIQADKAVAWASERMKIQFAPSQADALQMALSEKVSIITGGPGVGKTTLIRALVEVFGARQLQVCLAAPTGRAAKRMEEATRHEAMTIHRLLKFMPNTGQFDHGSANPLPGNVFILDEVSMVDLPLMSSFLDALPDAGCLVLVGDTDQLPSVGPGNVLRDLIHSGVVPYRKIETVFRQQTGGYIVRNAHRINHGEELELPPPGDRDADFYFIQAQEPDDVIHKMLDLITHRIPSRFGFDPMRDIQVLTPMRRNQLGADNLNTVLQDALNPSGSEVQRFGRKYRVGDRVMQVRNNYDKVVFNGDVGRILTLNTTDQIVGVDYDGRRVDYDLGEVDELVHAYACSIHKSQGSEYPVVVILMTTQHFKMLQRNLLYTALTRGRKLVCLVGSHKAIYLAIRNNEIRMRRTSLWERLQQIHRGHSVTVRPEET